MRYLLDTHTLLWAAFHKDLLSIRTRRLLQSRTHEFFLSAATAWEIATKSRLGRLDFAQALAEDFIPKVTSAGYLLLPISVAHALRAGHFPADHGDPFDRMLAAQSIHEEMPILSNDAQLDLFGVRRVW